MRLARTGVVGAVLRHASRLRYPQLFLVTAALLVLDVLIPDVVPFVDELLLGLAVLLLGGLRKRTGDESRRNSF